MSVRGFLRPAAIKEVQTSFTEGKISASELHDIEDEEIAKLVAKQKAAGYHAIIDQIY